MPSVFLNRALLYISHQWNHIICGLDDRLLLLSTKVFVWPYRYLIISYCRIIFHCRSELPVHQLVDSWVINTTGLFWRMWLGAFMGKLQCRDTSSFFLDLHLGVELLGFVVLRIHQPVSQSRCPLLQSSSGPLQLLLSPVFMTAARGARRGSSPEFLFEFPFGWMMLSIFSYTYWPFVVLCRTLRILYSLFNWVICPFIVLRVLYRTWI